MRDLNQGKLRVPQEQVVVNQPVDHEISQFDRNDDIEVNLHPSDDEFHETHSGRTSPESTDENSSESEYSSQSGSSESEYSESDNASEKSDCSVKISKRTRKLNEKQKMLDSKLAKEIGCADLDELESIHSDPMVQKLFRLMSNEKDNDQNDDERRSRGKITKKVRDKTEVTRGQISF